jgi:argininosuccinate synthase
MIRGHAIYEGVYLLGTSIARPLIAKDQIRVAKNLKPLLSHMEQQAKEMIK